MGIEEQFPAVDVYLLYTLVFDRWNTRLETVLHIYHQYASPNEVYCWWLHLKHGDLTLGQFS